MKRNRFAPVLGSLFVCAAAEAAIPLNSLQTFDVAPAVTNWTTRSAGGGGGTIAWPEALDVAIQTNELAAITNILPATTTGSTLGLAQWNSAGKYIQTRPAGVAYQVLLGAIQNTSGESLGSVVIAYDFGNPSSTPGAEDPGLNGLRTYYSLSGQANSWLPVPEFSTGQTGTLTAEISLGAWPAGSPLYLLWADDNGGPATDSAFTIDNFIALKSLPPPPPPSVQPRSTNVLEGQTIQLTFVGTGYGLAFQWIKDGAPIDPLLNPTARERRLVITNASPTDAGEYRVAVSNLAGGVISDAVPVFFAYSDDFPVLLFAYDVPGDPRAFRLSVNHELCTNYLACGSDATFPFNWTIRSEDFSEVFFPESISIQGTNVEFTIQSNRTVGKRYVIGPDPGGEGIRDIYGLPLSMGSRITSAPSLLFKQNVNGYLGTEDAEVAPPCAEPCPRIEDGRILVDLNNGGTESQGLLRFKDIFGFGPNQIPPGTRIILATLHLESTAAGAGGDPINLHRMLRPWSRAADNWNDFNNGIQADGIEANTNVDATIVSKLETVPFEMAVDVTTSLQSWTDGMPNNGWVLLSTGSDGYRFDGSLTMNPPALEVVLGESEPPCSFIFLLPPALITVAEGQPFALAPLVVTNCFGPVGFQWTKDGVEILGAHGPTYSVPAATLCDAGTYRLIASPPGRSVTSNPVVVTISADVVRPVLLRAFTGADGTNITLVFSKAMNVTNASDIAHYVLDPPLAVTRAALSQDGRSVTLTTAPRSPLIAYTLRVQDVTDNRSACVGSVGNVISPNPTLVRLTGVRVDVPWNTEWLYSTNNHDATLSTPAPWYAANFSPGPAWFTSQALFGMEASAGTLERFPAPLLTPLLPNTNSPPDQITSYFRKQIELAPLPPGATYALCHFIDDGAVFYLDGVELARVNMDRLTPTLFAQRAKAAVEASVQCFPFSAAAGSHLLAVEVHQAGLTLDPDLLFGVQIEALASAPRLEIEKSQPMISWNADSYWELLSSSNATGPYEPVSVSPSIPLGTYHNGATNPAAFYRLRYKGIVK